MYLYGEILYCHEDWQHCFKTSLHLECYLLGPNAVIANQVRNTREIVTLVGPVLVEDNPLRRMDVASVLNPMAFTMTRNRLRFALFDRK